MMRIARLAVWTLLVWPAFIANAAAQSAPQFDVASIKPSQTPPGRGPLAALREDINTTPGSLTMRNVTLATSIRWAYQLNAFQISGPDSISADRFDIMVKAGTPVPESQLRLMLQALLADRFKLMFHRQTKELSGYALVQGKGPNKLYLVEGEAGGEGSMAAV